MQLSKLDDEGSLPSSVGNSCIVLHLVRNDTMKNEAILIIVIFIKFILKIVINYIYKYNILSSGWSDRIYINLN